MDNGIQNNLQETGIVILHYIKEDLTLKCIRSIRENTPCGMYHIYVVDNNSPEPLEMDEDIDLTVIRNNCRFSTSGMNRGFYHALYESRYDHKYIVNMDNDVICHQGWLEPLVKEMVDNPNTGICGGKQWNESLEDYFSVGSDLSGWIYKSYPKERALVNWIQGSFVMFRSEMMRMIGLHDTRYQDICSDSDYCIHAIDRGWDVVFVPESNVTHVGGISYKEFPTDHSKDFGQMIYKWFGLKFNSFANVVPIDSQHQKYGRVIYKEEKR